MKGTLEVPADGFVIELDNMYLSMTRMVEQKELSNGIIESDVHGEPMYLITSNVPQELFNEMHNLLKKYSNEIIKKL
jgi:hypothetical protein